MSFYRTLFAVIAAFALSTAVFADDSMNQDTSNDANQQMSQDQTMSDNSSTSGADQKASSNMEQNKVNVNTATAKELSKVKGLNSSKAKAIVIYRKKHGDFKSLDDLKEVKGFKKMKDKTFKNLEDQLTVG